MRLTAAIGLAAVSLTGLGVAHPTLSKKARAEHWALLVWLPKKIHHYPARATAICHRHPRRFLCRVYYRRHVWHVWAPTRYS